MIVSWMLYAATVTAGLACAAALAERALRGRSLPARGAWAAALLLSVALPFATWTRAGGEPSSTAVALGEPEASAATAPPLADAVLSTPWWSAVQPTLRALDPWALRAWVAGSLVLLAALVASAARLARRARRWRPTVLGEHAVRISHDTGPAVVGLFRQVVVVPSWVLDLPEAERALILRHEREHVRARDPWLVLGAFALLLTFPWNPLLWWQFGRLRAAVELDCDGRVVRGWPSSERRRYGHLLVAVGTRMGTGAHRPALAAFAERTSSLERRIRTMFVTTGRPSVFTLGAWLVGASVLLVGACLAPGPDRTSPLEPELEAPPELEVPPEAPVGTPAFTPYTRAPELINRDEVVVALEREYPPLLRNAGIGGEVLVWLFVGEDGAVEDLRIDRSSGNGPLDRAAMEVGGIMRFEPAQNRDETVATWMRMPIVFGTPPSRRDRRDVAGPVVSSESEDDRDIRSQPVFTPYTVGPEITNRTEVTRALEDRYPQLLREAGIGGTARVWFFIDEEGEVQDTRIESSSGHDQLDQAALAVADLMRFTPALNRDRPTPVWVVFPVTFQVR